MKKKKKVLESRVNHKNKIRVRVRRKKVLKRMPRKNENNMKKSSKRKLRKRMQLERRKIKSPKIVTGTSPRTIPDKSGSTMIRSKKALEVPNKC
jgi:hypothetical protein